MSSNASALLEAFRAVREATEELADPLSPEDQGLQSMADASPTKWHRAHTTWFFETFVLQATGQTQAYDPSYEYLFNSYYNSVGAQYPRAERGLISRPSAEEVGRYRAWVDERICGGLAAGLYDEKTLSVIELGVHHEQQHQELLLTDVKHALSYNPRDPAYLKASPPAGLAAPEPLRWIGYREDLYDVGHSGRGFAFDNEGPRHRTYLAAFELAHRLVTNREYESFMADGGYSRPEFWLSEGFDFIQRADITSPLYWRDEGGSYSQFTLTGRRPIEDAEPVTHLSLFEADAYARWAGARLPREAEWEVAATATRPAGNFVEGRCFHPSDAPTGDGALQLWGDTWEWTQSSYAAYPGYAPVEGALGEYNGKFMSSQYVLRGGSCATPRGHVRASYRNFFPPGARWQFSGLRLARDR